MKLSTTREDKSCAALRQFPAFYGTRRLITEFTRALHLYLSWARPIQFTTFNPISKRIECCGLDWWKLYRHPQLFMGMASICFLFSDLQSKCGFVSNNMSKRITFSFNNSNRMLTCLWLKISQLFSACKWPSASWYQSLPLDRMLACKDHLPFAHLEA
jgi:hypothetical protein